MNSSSTKLVCAAGTKVTWINSDNIVYTITADNGGPTSTGLSNGQSYSFTYRVKGIYGYHSSEYQSMNGTVIAYDNKAIFATTKNEAKIILGSSEKISENGFSKSHGQ